MTEMVPTTFVHTPWQVEVVRGATDIDVSDGPVKFGTTSVKLGSDDAPTTVSEPLIYSPVGIRQWNTGACIEVPVYRQLEENGSVGVGTKILREMAHVHRVEFTHWGHIEITGLEERPDGTAVFAMWRVEPAD